MDFMQGNGVFKQALWVSEMVTSQKICINPSLHLIWLFYLSFYPNKQSIRIPCPCSLYLKYFSHMLLMGAKDDIRPW